MKRIRKMYSGVVPNGKVLTMDSNSNSDTYSCAYLNDKIKSHDYSTEEIKIGTWLGKPLYRKTIDCGALPNATVKSVSHNISNIDNIVDMKGTSTNGTIFFTIPYASQESAASSVNTSATKSVIYLATGTDRSAYTKTYMTLKYTKTTD